MMDTAYFIRYYHGKILGEKNGVYLVYYGSFDTLWYGIGCMVRNPETDEESCKFLTYDVPDRITQAQIDSLLAHPETVGALLRPENWRPPQMLLPVGSGDLPKLYENIREKDADWEDVARFPEFVLVKRIRHFHSDRYAIVTYREPGHFEGARRSGMKRSAKRKRRDTAAI